MSFACMMEIAIIADNKANKTAKKSNQSTVSDVINAWLPVVGAGTHACAQTINLKADWRTNPLL